MVMETRAAATRISALGPPSPDSGLGLGAPRAPATSHVSVPTLPYGKHCNKRGEVSTERAHCV